MVNKLKIPRVSDYIKIEDIKNWNDGDIITIKAGTGAGKSYFIKNVLYAFAKKNNKRILMLIHRTNCVNQFTEEIIRDRKTDIIDIRTYQSLESMFNIQNKTFDFSNYQYIVCDEFHYFMGDAGFNKTTDISLNLILSQIFVVKIFMSATGDYMKKYIKNTKELDTIDYELPITYNFIKVLTFYNKDESLEKFIEESIKTNQKAIFFIQSVKKAYELYIKYEEYCLFNCSKSNDEFYKFVNEEKIDNMLKNEKFEELILITTTCLDAGVNINDEKVKHIVVDVKDTGSLKQCIGRKRLQNENDKIYLYIKAITNEQLGGMETQLREKIRMAEYFNTHTVKEYATKYAKQYDKTQMVYDNPVEEDDKCTKKLNELMYFKCLLDIGEIEIMKSYKEYGYCKYLAYELGFYDDDEGFYYRTIQEDYERETLVNYLESMVGKVMLQLKDRKVLINNIDVRANGRQLKRINNLNGVLEEIDIPFRIIEFETSRIIDGKRKKYKNAWRVEKLVS